jgi:hypothetical protein
MNEDLHGNKELNGICFSTVTPWYRRKQELYYKLWNNTISNLVVYTDNLSLKYKGRWYIWKMLWFLPAF